MKKYKILFIIVGIMLLSLGLCFVFIKPKVLNFKNINEYTYLESHIDEVDKIVLETYTLLGKTGYLVDNEVGKDFLVNLKIKKLADYTVTDSNASLIVYFKSGDSINFDFEYNSFKYGGNKYEVDKNVWDLIDESKKEYLE